MSNNRLRLIFLGLNFLAWALIFWAVSSLMFGKAHAHDVWANGDPVPKWVKATCCGPQDLHHLRPDQVKVTAQGFLIEGYRQGPVPYGAALPSEDGDFWAFWADYPDGHQSPVYCFFAPVGGV